MKKQFYAAQRNPAKKVVPRLVKAVRPKLSVNRTNRPFPVIAIAVVLTGGDGNGSIGMQIIKEHGGKMIAQDRPTSRDFSMPETSIKTGEVDYILPLGEIAAKLVELVVGGKASSQGRTTGKRNPAIARGNSPRPSYAAGTKAAMVRRKK